MENFLNTLNEKILIIDYTGKILFLNKSLLIQLGYKPNEIINKNILSLTFTKDINAFLLKDTPLKNLLFLKILSQLNLISIPLEVYIKILIAYLLSLKIILIISLVIIIKILYLIIKII